MSDQPQPGKHPRQPIVRVGDTTRFQENSIICWLLDEGLLDLNDLSIRIAREQFPLDDVRQIMQQLGYSVSGYYDLSYTDEVPDEVYDADQAEAERVWKESCLPTAPPTD